MHRALPSRQKVWLATTLLAALGLLLPAPFVSAAPPRLGAALGVAPLLGTAPLELVPRPGLARAPAQDGGDGVSLVPGADPVVLVTLAPEVQWQAAGATSWMTIPAGQAIQPGDRVRTGVGATARLVFAPEGMWEIGAATELTLRRVERGPAGNLVAALVVASGTVTGPSVPAAAAAPRVEIETPAALVIARRTGPRVEVAADGTTWVSYPSDALPGAVTVEGKDPLPTVVTLSPGERTEVPVGAPPSPPLAQAPPAIPTAAPPAARGPSGPAVPEVMVPPPAPPAPDAAAGVGLVSGTLGPGPFPPAPPPVGPVGPMGAAFPPPGRLGPAFPGQGQPCAVAAGQVCSGTLRAAGQSGVGGTFTGIVQGSQLWRIDVTGADPQARLEAYVQTTLGFEGVPCPPLPPTSTTGRPSGMGGAAVVTCAGSTMGNGLQQGSVVVLMNGMLAAQGTLKGPGPPTPTPTPTAAPTATPTRTPTPIPTPTPVPAQMAAPGGRAPAPGPVRR